MRQKRSRWEQVYSAMLNLTKLPRWTQQDDVIRAFAEMNADLASGMLDTSRLWQIIAELRYIANTHRCLEAYEPIERALLAETTLIGLLEAQARSGRPMTPFAQRRCVWLDRAVIRKCQVEQVRIGSTQYRQSVEAARARAGLPAERRAA